MLSIQECHDNSKWDEYMLDHGGHPLQLWSWGEVKQAHDWRATRLFFVDDTNKRVGAAQVLIRSLPWPLGSFSYVPRGPIVEESSRDEILQALTRHVKTSHKSVAVAVEPDWKDVTMPTPWCRAKNTILIPRTVVLDLRQPEDALLGNMTKKTRQYIRKSQKEPIEIRQVTNKQTLLECLEIYKETARRAQFALHDDAYYIDIFEKLGDHSPVFAAFSHEKPVAFVWLAMSQKIAFELYGGVNEEGQNLRANYALKWHAITTAKKWGIERYDMNGLLNDGVSTFKQGFSNHDETLIGTYEAPLSIWYAVWAKGLPLAKRVVRFVKTLRN